jgi:hypothetical protein
VTGLSFVVYILGTLLTLPTEAPLVQRVLDRLPSVPSAQTSLFEFESRMSH